MKKAIRFLALMLAIAALMTTASASAERRYSPENLFSVLMKVSKIDKKGRMTLVDHYGNKMKFGKSEDLCVGDFVVAIIYDNKTPMFAGDDKVIKVTYSRPDLFGR